MTAPVRLRAGVSRMGESPQWDVTDVPLDTDDEHVLTLWREDGTTFDLRAPLRPLAYGEAPAPGRST